MDYTKRQDKLVKSLASRSLDALLVRKKQNISYLVGTRGEDAVLFVSTQKKALITDSRYKEEYCKTIKNCQLRIFENRKIYSIIAEISKDARSKRIGFESNNFSYSEYIDLKKKLNNATLLPAKETVESLRIIKDKDEIRRIKEACKYGCTAMNYGVKVARPSLSEDSVKQKIEAYLAKNRIKRADFDVIVASGENASMPHASASKKTIKKGEMVIIDLGTTNYGYNSDLTRTLFLGRIDRKYIRIYNIVLDAQKRAFEHIKPGVPASYIDRISRQYISYRGLGKYFIHSLGHGIGLEVHEKPHISRNSKVLLKENMSITVEPGVYIPGWGGVRIEDVVLVTSTGCEILTKDSKKMLCV